MTIPEISELQTETRKIVHLARRNGKLQEITRKTVRRTLEAQFGLEADCLNTDEYKQALNKSIESALEDDLNSAKDASPKKTSVVKPSNGNADSSSRNTKKRKSEDILESKSKKKQAVSAPKLKKNSNFKSAEVIPTSDVEDMEEVDDASAEMEEAPESGGSAKENQTTESKKPTSRKASGSATSKPKAQRPAKSESDSEMSVLEDEPPRKSKSKTSKSTEKAKEKSKAPKGKKAELSKDEETIKRLKSLVLACGIRKVWAKVFRDVDSPSEQIRMLKKMLTDLGMSGRMSMEQARAIKEKRELAQELEDVKAFAAAATKSKSSRKDEDQEDESDEEEEEEELPAKRKTNARTSIMAFLEDQSDED